MPPRRHAPRRAVRKGRKGLRRGRKSSKMPVISGLKMSSQNASIVETIQFSDLSANSLMHYSFTLSEFPRAGLLSQYFQFYKAAKVIWSIEPLYNVYQDVVGGVSKPYLYLGMNRIQRLNTVNATREALQAQGAQPQPLTSKKTISYVPNWCSPGLSFIARSPNTNTDVQGMKAQYGWLANMANDRPVSGNPLYPLALAPVDSQSAIYNGHFAYADMAISGADQPLCARVTATVHWVFKGARFDATVTPAPPPPVTTITQA